MAPESLNRIYADEMQNHPYGYGLYQPTFSTVIKPGSVGFFDPSGFWSPLADLTDPKSLDALGLKPPRHTLAAAPPQKQSWGPMTSKSTSAHNLDTSAGINPAITGLPLTANLQIKYTSSSSFGAVLVASDPVTHQAFYYTSPFQQWVTDNAHALLSSDFKDDIHANGLVVVTQTYTSPKCSLTAWTDTKSEAFLGFNVDVKGVGSLKPQGDWIEGNSADGWQKYEEDPNGPNQLVVFVGGLWYDVQKAGAFGMLPEEAMHPQDSISAANKAGEKYILSGKRWGSPLAKD